MPSQRRTDGNSDGGDDGDALNCTHYRTCSGCSLSHDLHAPPLAATAAAYFAERGLPGFFIHRGAVHGWNGPENFEESQQYIGLVPWVFLLGCAPLLLRLRGDDRLRAIALAAIAVLAASLGFGWWPLHPLLTQLPPFSVNANPRLLFLVQVAIPVLAALAARGWLTARDVSSARARGFAPLAAAAAIGALLLVTLASAERWELRPWIALASAVAVLAAGYCAA
ncbi:MAG: hypothetical protein NTZ61_03070, partial [Proteobacteria bacterium]|nr:hypothetical protein [Pseudomonadota bacterium]